MKRLPPLAADNYSLPDPAFRQEADPCWLLRGTSASMIKSDNV
jgi:hypothetical protein